MNTFGILFSGLIPSAASLGTVGQTAILQAALEAQGIQDTFVSAQTARRALFAHISAEPGLFSAGRFAGTPPSILPILSRPPSADLPPHAALQPALIDGGKIVFENSRTENTPGMLAHKRSERFEEKREAKINLRLEKARALAAKATAEDFWMAVIDFQQEVLQMRGEPTNENIRMTYSYWRRSLSEEQRKKLDEAMLEATGRNGGSKSGSRVDPRPRLKRAELAAKRAKSSGKKIRVIDFQRAVLNSSNIANDNSVRALFCLWIKTLSPENLDRLNAAMETATGRVTGQKWGRLIHSKKSPVSTLPTLPRSNAELTPMQILERAESLVKDYQQSGERLTKAEFQRNILGVGRRWSNSELNDAYQLLRATLNNELRKRLDAAMAQVT